MGAGASTGIAAAARTATDNDIMAVMAGLPDDARQKLASALSEVATQDDKGDVDVQNVIKLSVGLMGGTILLKNVPLSKFLLVSVLKERVDQALSKPVSLLVSPKGVILETEVTLEQSGLQDGDEVIALVEQMTETFRASDYNPVGIDYTTVIKIYPDDGNFENERKAQWRGNQEFAQCHPPEDAAELQLCKGAAAVSTLCSMVAEDSARLSCGVSFSEALKSNTDAAEKMQMLLSSATWAKYFLIPQTREFFACIAVIAGHRLVLFQDMDDCS